MPQEVLNIIWAALGTIVTGLIGWGVSALTVWLNGKIKDRKAASFLSRIVDIIGDAVKTIFQEFVDTLKKEGKFDKEAAHKAKEAALQIIHSQLTPDLVEFINNNFGDVEEWLKNQIEVAIYNFKK